MAEPIPDERPIFDPSLPLTPEASELLMDALNDAVTESGEWAGAPTPIHGSRLIMESRYPFSGMNGAVVSADGTLENYESVSDPVEEFDDEGYRIKNSWREGHRIVLLWEGPDGKTGHGFIPDGPGKRLDFILRNLGACEAWKPSAEVKALQKLKSLVRPHIFKQYMMTGTFLESSHGSGVTYIFRKLRPTIAMKAQPSGEMKVLAVLCLHPIGYYEDTWAGVMVPTDEVIAHLLLMRGAEHKFWARANHHAMLSAAAGI